MASKCCISANVLQITLLPIDEERSDNKKIYSLLSTYVSLPFPNWLLNYLKNTIQIKLYERKKGTVKKDEINTNKTIEERFEH